MLDDYFPAKLNLPLFSKSAGCDLWVLLLEKAYAKIYRNYKNIEAGFTIDALRDLTGAPGMFFSHTNQEPMDIWNILKKNYEKDYLITAGSQHEATKPN